MPNKASEIRIIAGKWRSRKLRFYAEKGLRPTLNHVRETLFNWLQFELTNKTVLDLFAGTGILALEALSRGAKQATLVESSARSVKQLQHNVQHLQAHNAQVVCADGIKFVQHTHQTYDLVFLDPPFHQGLLTKLIPILDNKLAEGSLIYLEHETDLNLSLPNSWHCVKSKSYKEFLVCLYQKTVIDDEAQV